MLSKEGVICMIYYALKLRTIPHIEFAFSTETNRYKNIISNRKNLIETSYITGGGFMSEFEGEKYKIESKYENDLLLHHKWYISISSGKL